jgi:hypothetical protein
VACGGAQSSDPLSPRFWIGLLGVLGSLTRMCISPKGLSSFLTY